MPYLNIQTNLTIDDDAELDNLLKKSSSLTAELLGKPEEFMMVALKDEVPMLFAGSADPTAFLELKSIGLNPDKTKTLSKALCELIESELEIPSERIYVKFNDAQRSMWGWKGDTF
mgnify:CR=1 FL=1